MCSGRGKQKNETLLREHLESETWSMSFQMLKKMEQAKKKAEAVVNTVDISEREKMAQLKRCDLGSLKLISAEM